jgi:hypothetical protein
LKSGHESALISTRIDASCLVHNAQYSVKKAKVCRGTGTMIALYQCEHYLPMYLMLYIFHAIVFYTLVLFPATAHSYLLRFYIFWPPIVAIIREIL